MDLPEITETPVQREPEQGEFAALLGSLDVDNMSPAAVREALLPHRDHVLQAHGRDVQRMRPMECARLVDELKSRGRQ